jgi:protein-tyrosine phosphatase
MTTVKPSNSVLRLCGAPNFRDLGGIRVGSSSVRHGQVYRSEDLSRLTAQDLDLARGLGVRLIFDLRAENERAVRPGMWPQDPGIEYLLADVLVDLRAGHSQLGRMLAEQFDESGARRMMIETYRMLPAAVLPSLPGLLQRLAAGQMPALIHCTAGKDRTGFVCSMLLQVLGAHRDDIEADYLATRACLDLDALAIRSNAMAQKVVGVSFSRPMLDVINGVESEYLVAAWTAIDEQYGSISQYLELAGINAEIRAALRRQLLEA